MNINLNRRDFLWTAGLGTAALELPRMLQGAGRKRPNFVIIFLDDSGWADFRPFGRTGYPTPNVERLASQGCRFNNFYVPQAVCSASRSALLSGCYPGRTKVFGAHPPNARGLDPKFATMGEVLKAGGYRTAVFGKWHIGDQPDTRPPARGFDESCGLMYSNDMWEFHPEHPEAYRNLPLHFWENGKIKIERVTKEHQPMLTTWYTEHAVDFIRRNRSHPFLLYVPHSMPHVPLFCSQKFKGKSGAGLYADVMMEIDWSVGEITKALKAAGVEDHTLVIFTSDNGPWISYGNHAGKTPFREAKGTGFDGGTRSACIMRYPGQIQAGSVSKRALCSVDLLPTLAHLAGAALPKNPSMVWTFGTSFPENPARSTRTSITPSARAASSRASSAETGTGSCTCRTNTGPWWRRVETAQAGKYRQARIELSLFDMEKDPFETTNVIDKFPEVAARLKGYAEQHKREFYQ